MPETLPVFRYHPNPLQTGSIAVSGKTCNCCGRSRGYIYTLAPYSEEDLEEESLCPWCIAGGEAHRKFGAEFLDVEGIPNDVPEAAMQELVERTPGYAAWQSEEWRACCDDATAFLGPFGYPEIERKGAGLVTPLLAYIMEEMDYQGETSQLLESLDRDRGPTAYVFQCLHCRRYLFHIDSP
ncbi:MAG TPA: CbrC family protein [Bryobacteraceae bacterium]|jgi:hypothetical protein